MRSALACVLLVPLAACTAQASGGEFTLPARVEPPPPPRLPPRPPQPPPKAVLASYREFHRVLEDALGRNDASLLPEVAAEPLASRLVALIGEHRRRSVVRRTHLALNPRLAWIKDRTALVLDCVYSPGLTTFDAASGRRRGPRPVDGRVLVETLMRLENTLAGRVWKVWRVGEVRPC